MTLPDFLDDFTHNMRSTYSVLGMMMVGLGLSTIPKFEIDLKFTLAAFASKFLFFPVAINLFILLDKFIFGWYDNNYYNALQLLFMAPMAAKYNSYSFYDKVSTRESCNNCAPFKPIHPNIHTYHGNYFPPGCHILSVTNGADFRARSSIARNIVDVRKQYIILSSRI
jgi:hypothetical protein